MSVQKQKQKQKQQPSMQDSFSHKEVFGYLKDARFSGQEAAEYLEISMPTLDVMFNLKRLNQLKSLEEASYLLVVTFGNLKNQFYRPKLHEAAYLLA